MRRIPPPWLGALTLACGVASMHPAGLAAQADSTGTIVVIVSARDAGVPLPYSVVSVAPTSAAAREQFTNDRGVLTLARLPRGAAHLRVRHLGYAPRELDVAVRAALVDTVRVPLAQLAVRLGAVQVRAYPPCTNPGPPGAADSAFATVFDQLRQNAEQFRLLTSAYPFIYSVERTTSVAYANNTIRREKVDTIAMRSTDEWRYAPGALVTRERSGFLRSGTVTMRIPTLAHFADSVFVANHCFFDGGVDVVDGRELLRVDFVAAARIKDPDVDGAMYLDPTTFQIRRTFLRLSKTPAGIPDLLETEATTLFGELLPSVPVIAQISSVNRLRPSHLINPATATTEDQRLIAVMFTAGRPGEGEKKP